MSMSPLISLARNTLLSLVVAAGLSPLGLRAQNLSPAQIKQIEEIASNIAAQHNANATAMLDDMTVSSRAVASGRNVRIENVLRVKRGLPAQKLQEFSTETRRDIVPRVCATNARNPAFDRGLSYTFTYANTYGERLAEFSVDKSVCARN